MSSKSLVPLLLGLTLAACAGQPMVGAACETNQDCADGLVCRQNACEQPAAFDEFSVDDVTLSRATEGEPYSAFLTASNGSDPLRWSLPDGVLPAGLTLLESGQIAGVPSVGAAAASPFGFTVAVTDIQEFVATRSLSIAVDPAEQVERYPLEDMNNVTLYLNLGDSFGAGYNASDGRGYAPLVHRNHASYASYASHHVRSLFSGAQLVNRAESGAKSGDVVGQTSSLPGAGGGDVIVTIYVGGNDFNDDLEVILLEQATQAAIASWESNMATVMQRLRAAYDHPETGQQLVVLMATIHDPTDGLATIPAQYDDGFCATIHQVPDFLRPQSLANFHSFNQAIRRFADDNDAITIDTNVLFIGHGLNAPSADQWIDSDCAHGNNEGHHQVRREIWYLLTGERF